MRIRNKENIEIFCKYCERATPLVVDGKLVCSKMGVVSEDYKCRKFVYDPLKRAPKIMSLDTTGLEFPDMNDSSETND